jgi:hypothetical protein
MGNEGIRNLMQSNSLFETSMGKQINTSQYKPQPQNKPQQSQYKTPSVTNNSSQITDMYAQQLASSQAALKASIQQSMGTYKDSIAKAPGTYQPLRDQASYQGANNMQNLKEMLANDGQQGGVNRTEQTQVNSNMQNNINSLNQQQQSVIDSANKAIADLKAQGNIRGAELVAQNASERIRALIDESNRVDSETYSRGRDTLADTRYNTEYADQRGDVAYNRLYQTGRDKVQDTGMLPNGQYTQSGALNNAQLKELTDPHSISNQMAKLGLDTAKLNYAALPAQLKSQAQLIAQQLSQGAIDIKTAQTKLNYLPKQIQSEINAANRSNRGGGGGGGRGGSNELSQSELNYQTLAMAEMQEKNGTGMQWLNANEDEIRAQPNGGALYKNILTRIKNTRTDPDIAYQLAKATSARKNGNMRPQY